MTMLPPVFAYFGPETMLPFTSILATVVGILMIFGKHSLRLITRSFFGLGLVLGKRRKRDRSTRPLSVPLPHFSVKSGVQSPSEADRS
jgi:hypothetical protein